MEPRVSILTKLKYILLLALLSSMGAVSSYAQDYHFQEDSESAKDNTSIGLLEASCNTVSFETILFSETMPGVFVAHDSIAFGEENFKLSCTPSDENADVNFTKQASPLPGKSDTAIFHISSADGSTTTEYKAVISRSLYQCKTGFLIKGGSEIPNGWSSSGGNYATDSKGDGGAFPGSNGMRLFVNSSSDAGVLTTPVYSYVGTLSFSSKFSKTDDESLRIMKSTDDGTSWEEIKTFTPAGGEIPAYSTEQIADTLAMQTLEINEENVMLSFQYQGSSNTPRLMIDDIACSSAFDPDETYSLSITVYDIDHMVLQGASVSINDTEIATGSDGLANFENLSPAYKLPYSVAKDGFTMNGELTILANTIFSITHMTEEIDMFLALGQSNMAGRGAINEYVDHEIANVSLLNDQAVWKPAVNPMNLYSNIRKDADDQKLGPSYSFSKTLTSYVDKRIGMIVNGRGGTNISEFLGPYHDPILQRIDESRAYGQIKGVIWHQGEGDKSKAALYMGRLTTMVESLRAEVGAEVYFVAGQLGPWDEEGTDVPKYGVINDTIAKIANYISYTDYVKSDRLSDIGDNSHFNTRSQILLGQRYAKKILNEIYDIQISIIEISLEGDGYIVYGADTITRPQAYSYTIESQNNVVLSIDAGEGKEFVQLLIDGVEISSAVGDSIYEYSINAEDDLYIPIKMTIQDFTTTSTKIREKENFIIYPNPATEFVSIQGEIKDFLVQIFDNTGRLVLKDENNRNIDLQNLSSGTYLFMLQTPKEQKTQLLYIL